MSKIPLELRSFRQWALSGIDKAPLSTDGKVLFNVSVKDKTYLLTYDEAIRYSTQFGCNYGFILFSDDPFTCIDMDVTDKESQIRKNEPINPDKWTTEEQKDRFWKIIVEANTYTEVSLNGKGGHIWVKANIGEGARRDGIEIYSQERYIICTGKAINNLPINDRQDLVDRLKSQMKPNVVRTTMEELPQVMTDDEVISMAINADNSKKFIALCNGQFEDYPSQSEADLALMSIFTFYSQSNEQCRRLFRMTDLGQRKKAVQDDRYLNNTLQIIRNRQNNEQIIENAQKNMADELVRSIQEKYHNKTKAFAHTEYDTTDVIPDKPLHVNYTEVMLEKPLDEGEGIPWPPGIIGKIAHYIFNSAPRPVKEVAIVAAFGLMAGICGKSWTINDSGLNLYMILLGRSGIGKEALHSGISSLINAISSREASAINFVNFANFVSGPALSKTLAENNCFVNVTGEFGRKLKRMSNDNGRDSGMDSLRTVMTDIYQKSGPRSIVGGQNHSDSSSNTASVNDGVAFSMIGESTPGTFYECLTETMMEDGFLSRFSVIEHYGIREQLNLNQIKEPDKVLCDYLAELCAQSVSLMNNGITTQVQRTKEVAEILANFEKECDNQINGSNDESWRQVWNRASLKVLKLSALLAVADNYIHPVVQYDHVIWALLMVRADIKVFEIRIKSGDIGISDNAREKKILSILEQYLENGVAKSYKVNPDMRFDKIVTRKYLQLKTAAVSSFAKHSQGSNRALDITIQSLKDSGYISEVKEVETIGAYGYQGKCYRILCLKH